MNLHAIANRAIQRINPNITVQYRMSDGYATATDGTRTPAYKPAVPRSAQFQPLGTKDIQQVEGLNLGGTTAKLYLYGMADGIVRVERKGGDLVSLPDGSIWLVTGVFEQWPDWVAVGIALQNEACSS